MLACPYYHRPVQRVSICVPGFSNNEIGVTFLANYAIQHSVLRLLEKALQGFAK